MTYHVPRADIQFVFEHLVDVPALLSLPGNEELSAELLQAVLDEGARYIEQEVVPLNQASDRQPPQKTAHGVTTTPGFKAAYQTFQQSGWQGLQHSSIYGGQGLPKLVGAAFGESMSAACASFALCPVLTDSVIETLIVAGTPSQQELYLPSMITGAWTGTMNLTEPQAGSDLSLVQCQAIPQSDGSYRLHGEKIFISYGEHDLADNIIHLVLARTPEAAPGIAGLSLFLVPHYLVQDQGDYAKGARNDVICASLEEKMGLHGSPTAVMRYGDDGGEVGAGAIAYLVGELNQGLNYMFITMNAARFAIGIQALGVADRALYQAEQYAAERQQGPDLKRRFPSPVYIHHHPDVERMLQTMRALTESTRALSYYAAWLKDMALHHPHADQAANYQRQHEFLVPIVKGFATEMVNEVAALGIQVHGGMGFIEETGAAQYARDCRVFAIYEGTTAIQANDLIGRKVLRDQGQQALSCLIPIRTTIAELEQQRNQPELLFIAQRLEQACQAYEQAVSHLLQQHQAQQPRAVYFGSVPFLMLAGIVLGGWMIARSAQASVGAETEFLRKKISTALSYAAYILPRAQGHAQSIQAGALLDQYSSY
ncbi:acyl-CoA dehydrogenase [Paenalcaligenes hominis]|uniref:acyl-CoA dehydrogenase n=1 Tax=Paenalcaligenes hominis TaxID=643674 RepID=UPI003524DD44